MPSILQLRTCIVFIFLLGSASSEHPSIAYLREMASQVDIPKKYKACVYDEPGKISTKVVELDMPEVRMFG